MTTYEDVHAGDIVLGHDGDLWGVERIVHVPQITVTLVKWPARVTGYPPDWTPVTIVERADTRAESWVAGLLVAAGLGPVSIIAESWES